MRITLFFALLFFGSCLGSKSTQKANTPHFKIEILQNDKVIKPQGEVVKLKKEPFAIQVTLLNIEGVHLAGSFNRKYYDVPKDENIYTNHFTAGKIMAELEFNSKKRLILADDVGINYWFYDPDLNWYRFDKGVKVKGKKVIGLKTIESFFFPANDKTLPLAEVEKDLYLVAAASRKLDGVAQEIQREKLILKFE